MKINKSFLTHLGVIVVALLSMAATWWLFDPQAWWAQLQQPEAWAVPAEPTKPPYTPITQIPPTHISIPSLNKDLVVSAGIIHHGEWDLYDDKVAWLATSAIPGQGNVIMYAHNRRHLFGDLGQLRLGDEILVTHGDKLLTYTVRQLRQIKPDEVEAILSDQNQLTLYTCGGSFDQKRLVVYADPQ